MTLVLGVVVAAILLGYALGGRLGNLAALRVRWPPLAMAGLLLQLATGRFALLLLFVSFALLLAFVVGNLALPGFRLVLLGLVLNVTVIAINGGMPVSRQAVVRSGQGDALGLLIEKDGAKHHLAGPGDHLMALGDVIAVGPPVRQAISVGDLAAYGGVVWLLVVGMRGRREPIPRPVLEPASSPQ